MGNLNWFLRYLLLVLETSLSVIIKGEQDGDRKSKRKERNKLFILYKIFIKFIVSRNACRYITANRELPGFKIPIVLFLQILGVFLVMFLKKTIFVISTVLWIFFWLFFE